MSWPLFSISLEKEPSPSKKGIKKIPFIELIGEIFCEEESNIWAIHID